MPLATSAKVAAACSLAGLATDTEGANVLDGASAVDRRKEKKDQFKGSEDLRINQVSNKPYSLRWHTEATRPRRW